MKLRANILSVSFKLRKYVNISDISGNIGEKNCETADTVTATASVQEGTSRRYVKMFVRFLLNCTQFVYIF